MIDLFIVDTVELSDTIKIHLMFEKDMNLTELVECYIQIEINLDSEHTFKDTQKIRYVYKDKLIGFDKLLTQIMQQIEKITKILDAIDSGLNLSSKIYLEVPGLDQTDISVRRSIKRSLGNFNEYKLQPYIIKLYTILTSYKGTDTLQQRKFKKMIEAQEDALMYQRSNTWN